MEALTDKNIGQAIMPPSWEQLQAELPECVEALTNAALGLGGASIMDLPVWYVFAKAAGASSLPLAQIYNDPEVRKHALGVLIVEGGRDARLMQMQEERLREQQGRQLR